MTFLSSSEPLSTNNLSAWRVRGVVGDENPYPVLAQNTEYLRRQYPELDAVYQDRLQRLMTEATVQITAVDLTGLGSEHGPHA